MTSTIETYYSNLEEAASFVRAHIDREPRVAIVLGSGLGRLAEEVDDPITVPYADIPHFPTSTVVGHAGKLVVGRFQGQSVAMMSGRVHLYEGYSAKQVVFPTRLLQRLGVRTLILTNAAGGINSSFSSGALMLITDHINMTGHNPLSGPNDERFGVRFPDMTYTYTPALQDRARAVAKEVGVKLDEGVYLGLLGPTYETPAEIRMMRGFGGDAVGMSTVSEAIAANHMGMNILGMSCITNMAAGMLPQALNHQEVMETAERVSGDFARLVRGIVAGLGDT